MVASFNYGVAALYFLIAMVIAFLIGRWWGVVLVTIGSYIFAAVTAERTAPDVSGLIALIFAIVMGSGALVGYVLRLLVGGRPRRRA